MVCVFSCPDFSGQPFAGKVRLCGLYWYIIGIIHLSCMAFAQGASLPKHVKQVRTWCEEVGKAEAGRALVAQAQAWSLTVRWPFFSPAL